MLGARGGVRLRGAAYHGTALLAVCALADSPGNLGAARQIKDSFERLIDRYEKAHPEVVVGRHVTQGCGRTALLALRARLSCSSSAPGGAAVSKG